MPWFPFGREEADAWRLDIVALLAVTGESFIAEHAQAISSSRLAFIPRIMPAPQALMRPWRPASLPSEEVKVTGVHSGTLHESLGFFADIIHPIDMLPPLSFTVLRIEHTQASSVASARPSEEAKQRPLADAEAAIVSGADGQNEPSSQNIRRRATIQDHVADFVSNAPVMQPSGPRKHVSPSIANLATRDSPEQPSGSSLRSTFHSPLNILTVFSFFLTMGLIIAAIVWEDGTALLALCLISMAASIIGFAAYWRPSITHPRPTHVGPVPGDVIIRTRQGAMLLVRCSERVAMELYNGIEECEYYVSPGYYRVLMIVGAIIIMPSVILFGNCSFNMQLLVGVSYMVLNVLYWSLGLIPRSSFWDLRRFTWAEITPPDAFQADTTEWEGRPDGYRSYPRTLWYAIRETKSTDWVQLSGAVPDTPSWRQWLKEAKEAAERGERTWQAMTRKTELMSLDAAPNNGDGEGDKDGTMTEANR